MRPAMRSSMPARPRYKHGYEIDAETASVILDALLQRPDEPEVRVILEAFPEPAEGLSLTAMYNTLRQHAHDVYRERFPRANAKGTDGQTWKSWHVRYGMLWSRVDGEDDYTCMYCRESVATLAANGRQLPRPFVAKLEKHGAVCAMMFLVGMLEPIGGEIHRRRRLVRR